MLVDDANMHSRCICSVGSTLVIWITVEAYKKHLVCNILMKNVNILLHEINANGTEFSNRFYSIFACCLSWPQCTRQISHLIRALYAQASKLIPCRFHSKTLLKPHLGWVFASKLYNHGPLCDETAAINNEMKRKSIKIIYMFSISAAGTESVSNKKNAS